MPPLDRPARRDRGDLEVPTRHLGFAARLSCLSRTSFGSSGCRKLPNVFTEHGAVMLAGVLNSPIAVQTSVRVVRAFVRLRQMLESNSALARKLDALEKRYDSRFRVVFQAIRELMAPPVKPPKRIGFKTSRP